MKAGHVVYPIIEVSINANNKIVNTTHNYRPLLPIWLYLALIIVIIKYLNSSTLNLQILLHNIVPNDTALNRGTDISEPLESLK